jgi:hypothetical protein
MSTYIPGHRPRDAHLRAALLLKADSSLGQSVCGEGAARRRKTSCRDERWLLHAGRSTPTPHTQSPHTQSPHTQSPHTQSPHTQSPHT